MHVGNIASLLIVYHITKTEMVDRRQARFLNINLGLAIFLIDHVCGERRVIQLDQVSTLITGAT